MKKRILRAWTLAALLGCSGGLMAQRAMDHLDRGLVAMKSGTGVYLSWRIHATEYYDVAYNVYRDGTLLNEKPLIVSCFQDNGGTAQSRYTVKAVVRGVEQAASAAVTPWSSSYKEIVLKHEGIKSTLVPNDACCADVDGDGELEILMKFDNLSEIQQSFPKDGPVVEGKATGEYSIFEVLKQDGRRLWWVNCGPNMGDFQNNEQNIVAYDWDGDGKAEAVMRAADGTVIHKADGTTYTVGNASVNHRAATGGGANWFMHDGAEYLVYLNGETGEVYQCIPYPLARLESGERDLKAAWGDGYGHRSTKHFFGAPYLDGRKPSIFLARGIYTRHKMVALDVDPATHTLVQRWKWYNNTNGPWKGQGYHNYAIADVDLDGRDEIVFGSMVIDDNGKGLSTTGFGHGDAQHVGDLNPFMPGLEQFACNEDAEGYNYRNATTSAVYASQLHVGKDVGRAMAGNFTESFPGGLGTAWGEPISTVTGTPIAGLHSTGVNSNFRIYWDGDLVSETFNYINGKNTAGCIAKYGSWSPIYTCEGSLTNNDTKGTPCYQGDILGDWREELIMRTAQNNIRIYSTPVPTVYRNYSLWYDHQYRNAMVWQMCGYNQPPHVSYFMGKMEGFTQAPPPLYMAGRVEVKNGGRIDASLQDKDVLVCEAANTQITLASGSAPRILTFNVPTWVQGSAPSECATKDTRIDTTTYACKVMGGGMTGNGRLVKQGDGILTLPKAAFTHTGNTDVWAGVLQFDGTLKQSDLWLNRFAELHTDGGEFKSIRADYGSRIAIGSASQPSTLTVDSLALGYGARCVIDLYGTGNKADCVKMRQLSIESKASGIWLQAGPAYLKPVIELVAHPAVGQQALTPGKYIIGEVSDAVTGSVEDLLLEGLEGTKKKLYLEEGKLVLEVVAMRAPAATVWTGAQSTAWDLDETENFALEGESAAFVSGDDVSFGDEASLKTVSVVGHVLPRTFTVNSSAAYTFQGEGSIDGAAQFVKEGSGRVTMKGNNSYTGGNTLRGGVTSVAVLAGPFNETGNLGAITEPGKFVMEQGAELHTTAAVQNGTPITLRGSEGGVLNNVADFKMEAPFSGTLLTKRGSGCLFLNSRNTVSRLTMQAGSMALAGNAAPPAIELQGGILYDDAQNTSHLIHVPQAKSATWQLTYAYYTAYANRLTGEGTLTIVPRNNVSRVRLSGDWSQFAGTLKHNTAIDLPLDLSNGTMPHATLDVASGSTVASTVNKSYTFGAVTGKGTLRNAYCDFTSSKAVTGNVTWSIGNSDGHDFIFEGLITDFGSTTNRCLFNKVGTCKMTFKGKGDFSGDATVRAGELCLNSTTSDVMLGRGRLNVLSGATLSGKGTLDNGSVTVARGATLRPGITERTTGTLQFGDHDVTVNGTVQCYLSSKTSYAKLTGIKTLTLSSTATLVVKVREGQTWVEGTEFKILDAQTLRMAADCKWELDAPSATDASLVWDTSRLATEGILVLDRVDAVSDLRSSTEGAEEIYSLAGVRQTKRPTQMGIFLVNGVKTLLR